MANAHLGHSLEQNIDLRLQFGRGKVELSKYRRISFEIHRLGTWETVTSPSLGGPEPGDTDNVLTYGWLCVGVPVGKREWV